MSGEDKQVFGHGSPHGCFDLNEIGVIGCSDASEIVEIKGFATPAVVIDSFNGMVDYKTVGNDTMATLIGRDAVNRILKQGQRTKNQQKRDRKKSR